MRNITLSADEQLIDRTRQKAQKNKTTLNAEFHKWIESYTNQKGYINPLNAYA